MTTNAKTLTLADATKIVNQTESTQSLLNRLMAQDDGAALLGQALTRQLEGDKEYNPTVIRAQLRRVPVGEGEKAWTVKLDKAAKVYTVVRTSGRAAKAGEAEKTLSRALRNLIKQHGVKMVTDTLANVIAEYAEGEDDDDSE